MTEEDYLYLYVKYNEYKSSFADGKIKPAGGGDLGYATNLRFTVRLLSLLFQEYTSSKTAFTTGKFTWKAGWMKPTPARVDLLVLR